LGNKECRKEPTPKTQLLFQHLSNPFEKSNSFQLKNMEIYKNERRREETAERE